MARVSFLPDVAVRLRNWADLAARLGLSDVYLRAVREMGDHLHSDPETWGDPLRDFTGLKLRVYRRYGPVLVVYYSVYIDGTPVFVQDVQLTPDSPLFRAAGQS